MNPSAAAFLRACQERGLKCSAPQVVSSGSTLVSLTFDGSHGNRYTLRFLFSADARQVSIRIFGLVTGRREIFSRMVMRCNTMNNRFPWVKFVVDEDLDLNLEADCIITPETAETVCMEMLSRMVLTAREAYPAILNSYPLPGETF